MAGKAALGLARIDEDHQELFRRLAELRSAIRAGVRSEVTETLGYVRGYVDSHFEREEREMLATRYPLYRVHRAAHGRLAREVRGLEQQWEASGVTPALADGVLGALSEWFDVHVLELDSQLVRHLRARATPGPALGWPANVGRLPRPAGR